MRAQRSITRAILSSSSLTTCSVAATMCAAAGWAATHPAIDSPASTPSVKRSTTATGRSAGCSGR